MAGAARGLTKHICRARLSPIDSGKFEERLFGIGTLVLVLLTCLSH